MKICLIQDKRNGRLFLVPATGNFSEALGTMQKFDPRGDFTFCGETPDFTEATRTPIAMVSVSGRTELPTCQVLLEDVALHYPDFKSP